MLNIIIKKELRDYKKSTIFWSLGILFFLYAGMSKFQGFSQSDVSISELLKGLPTGFSSFFGLGSIDLETAGGYFAVTVVYLAVMLGIHAVMLGSGIFAKEEKDKTAEFIYTKPISRSTLYCGKISSALLVVIFLNLITTILSMLIIPIFNNGVGINGDILLLMPSLFLVQVIFLTIGYAISSATNLPKKASKIGSIILLVTFVLATLSDVVSQLNFLRYFSPFKYFDGKEIFETRNYNVIYVVSTILVVWAIYYAARHFFKRRDIQS